MERPRHVPLLKISCLFGQRGWEELEKSVVHLPRRLAVGGQDSLLQGGGSEMELSGSMGGDDPESKGA